MSEEKFPENKNGSRWKKILLSIAASPVNSLLGRLSCFMQPGFLFLGKIPCLLNLRPEGLSFCGCYGHLPKALSSFCCLSPCWPPALLSIINIPTAMKSSVKTTEAVGTANGKPAKKKAAFGSRSDAGSRISPAVFQAGAF